MQTIRVSGRELVVELEQRLAQADEALNRLSDPTARLWHALGETSGHRTLPEHGGPAGGWPDAIGAGLRTVAARIAERRDQRYGPTRVEATCDARLGAVCRHLVGADGELLVDLEGARIFLLADAHAFRGGARNALHEQSLETLLAPCRNVTTTRLRGLLDRPTPSVERELERMGEALEELDDA